MSTLIERPDTGSTATSPAGVYVNILDGVAGALMVRTRPVTLKQIFGSVVSDPANLLTTDMTKKQAPLFAMPISANGSPNWHLDRTSVAAVSYTKALDPNTRTIAGTPGVAGEVNGVAGAAKFNGPNGICFDNAGNLIVCDVLGHTVRKVAPDGTVTTLCGTPGVAGNVNTAPGRLNGPGQPVVDPAGNIYFTDSGNFRVKKLTPAGVLSIVGGSANCDAVGGYDGIAMDSQGYLYWHHAAKIHKNLPSASALFDIAGKTSTPGSADGTGINARFSGTVDNLWYDKTTDAIYIADAGNHTIRKMTPQGVVTTIAGLAGQAGSADGQGAAARFNTPRAVCMDQRGYLYVSDFGNHTIRRISPTGVVTTIAGQVGKAGYANGVGTASLLNQPDGIAVHPTSGDIYVSEHGNHIIRVIPNPDPPASAGDYALTVSYGGSDLPVMGSGVIPAGWRVALAAWAAQDGAQFAGFSVDTAKGPRDVYFVPCFQVTDDTKALVHLGDADFSWTMNFKKPLNPGQNPKFAVTVTLNGVTTALTATVKRNDFNQMVGISVVIPGSLIQVAGSQGTIRVVVTEALRYLKAASVVTETLTYLDKTFTETFSSTAVTPPLITSARMLLQSECAAGDQPTVLQWRSGANGSWSVTENVWSRFSTKVQATNAQLKRWELWWVPSPAARQATLFTPSGWIVPPAGRNYTNMPARMLTQGNFAANLTEADNIDVRINTYDYWPLGCSGRGALMVKVFDTLGNSKSLQVSPMSPGRDADGTFLNIGLTQHTERYNWYRQTTSKIEGGYLRCYVAGGPGPESRGAYYPAGYENFIASCGCINEGASKGRAFSYGLWLYHPWDFELQANWGAGLQKIHFVIKSKSGRVIDDYLSFNVAAFPVSTCCFLEGTLVQTPEGNRPIESIKEGDKVYTYDFAAGKHVVAEVSGTVEKLRNGLNRLSFDELPDVYLTEDHALYTPEKAIPWSAVNPALSQEAYGNHFNFAVQQLNTDDALLDIDGQPVALKGITPVPGDHTTYTLSLKGENRWYFAGGILAHNALDRDDSYSKEYHSSNCCFPPGTPVTLADGTTEAIELIPDGALVRCFDVLTQQRTTGVAGSVGKFIRNNMCTITFVGGRVLEVTDDHPLYTKQAGWCSIDPYNTLQAYGTEAGKLEVGFELLFDDGEWRAIESMTREEGEFVTYSLMNVTPYHNFYAGGVLAHNRSDGSSTCSTSGGSTTVTRDHCCVREDTLISTPSGDRPIKELKAGDLVYTFDPSTKQTRVVPITRMVVSVRDFHFRLTFHDGTQLFVSDDHPLGLIDARWGAMDAVKAQRLYGDIYGFVVDQLSLGDTLLGIISNRRVIGIDRINETLPLYTFDVQNPMNTYFANGVMVHNRCD